MMNVLHFSRVAVVASKRLIKSKKHKATSPALHWSCDLTPGHHLRLLMTSPAHGAAHVCVRRCLWCCVCVCLCSRVGGWVGG